MTHDSRSAFQRGMLSGAKKGVLAVAIVLFIVFVILPVIKCQSGACTALFGDEDEVSFLLLFPFFTLVLAFPGAAVGGLIGGVIAILRQPLETRKAEFHRIDLLWLIGGFLLTAFFVHAGINFVTEESQKQVRYRVHDAMWATAGVRKDILEFRDLHGEWPESLDLLGEWQSETNSTAYKRYVAEMKVSPGGVLISYLKGNEKIEGHFVKFTPVPRDGRIDWICSSDLEPAYFPKRRCPPER